MKLITRKERGVTSVFQLSEEQEQRALRLHRESIVFDAHCDTILQVLEGKRTLGERSKEGHLDIPRLKNGGIKAQVFSVFVKPEWYSDAVHATLKGIAALKREFEKNAEDVVLTRSAVDIEKATAEGKIAALISVEGGEALQGDLDMLRIYRELGVSSLVLTWNNRNAIADGAGDTRSGGGLSSFGVEVIKEMERLGMVVDLAHISPQGFWDALEIVSKPIIVSHSMPRKFMDIPRNLDDDQIKAVAEKGGVIGVSFYFTGYGGVPGNIEKVLDAIDYIVNIGGVDCVGIGSDFDGFKGTVEGLESCEEFINITRGLVYRGYTDEDIRKILGKNFLRVFEKVQS
ncbi:MAG: dipeptidase [Thermosediminibacteraceae bacterium]|nr:dipeptidase [Thermosediminibacteraceae bacterium]